MSNKLTLDSLRESIEAKYSSTTIALDVNTDVVLRNTLRLSAAEREALSAELDKLRTQVDEEPVEGEVAPSRAAKEPEESVLGQVIRILVGEAHRDKAERLLALFPDAASRSFIVNEGLPQAGEASGSQS